MREGRQRGGRARLGYLSRGPIFKNLRTNLGKTEDKV